MYAILLLAACCGLSVAMVIHDTHSNGIHKPQTVQEELQQEQQRQLDEATETVELDMSQPGDRQEYLRWMQEIVNDNKYKHMQEQPSTDNVLQHDATLLRQVLAQRATNQRAAQRQEALPQQLTSNVMLHKRFTDFTTPYLKYKLDKRTNGIWIWMPAQGYVSVPRQEETSENAIGKPGKIMRYGRK